MKTFGFISGIVLCLASASSAGVLFGIGSEVGVLFGHTSEKDIGSGMLTMVEFDFGGNLSYGLHTGVVYFGEMNDERSSKLTFLPLDIVVLYRICGTSFYAGGLVECMIPILRTRFLYPRIFAGPLVGYRMALTDKVQLGAFARYPLGPLGKYWGERGETVYAGIDLTYSM